MSERDGERETAGRKSRRERRKGSTERHRDRQTDRRADYRQIQNETHAYTQTPTYGHNAHLIGGSYARTRARTRTHTHARVRIHYDTLYRERHKAIGGTKDLGA